MRHSSIVEVEILPGVVALVDESCWQPLPTAGRSGPSLSYNSGPDRPCRPCSDDYRRAKGRPPSPGRQYASRLADGFAMLEGAPW